MLPTSRAGNVTILPCPTAANLPAPDRRAGVRVHPCSHQISLNSNHQFVCCFCSMALHQKVPQWCCTATWRWDGVSSLLLQTGWGASMHRPQLQVKQNITLLIFDSNEKKKPLHQGYDTLLGWQFMSTEGCREPFVSFIMVAYKKNKKNTRLKY